MEGYGREDPTTVIDQEDAREIFASSGDCQRKLD
jgi:hypothetical protein